MKPQKSIPGGVLGIIGSSFCLIGAMIIMSCTCTLDSLLELMDANELATDMVLNEIQQRMVVTTVLCVIGSVAGLVGAILDFKMPIIGGSIIGGAFLFQLVGVMLSIQILVGVSSLTIVGTILYVPSAITSFLVRRDIVDPNQNQNGQGGPQGPNNGPQGPNNYGPGPDANNGYGPTNSPYGPGPDANNGYGPTNSPYGPGPNNGPYGPGGYGPDANNGYGPTNSPYGPGPNNGPYGPGGGYGGPGDFHP